MLAQNMSFAAMFVYIAINEIELSTVARIAQLSGMIVSRCDIRGVLNGIHAAKGGTRLLGTLSTEFFILASKPIHTSALNMFFHL
jgi:hypothetical protein